MEKERKQSRSHLTFYLDVIDGDSGKRLGKVGDISTEGLLLIARDSVEIGKHLHLEISSSDGSIAPIRFQSSCRWSKKDVNPNYYVAGFHMDFITDEVKQNIIELINDSYFDY